MAIITRITALITVILLFAGCPAPTSPDNLQTAISVSDTAVTLTVGESFRVRATSSNILDTIAWATSDANVATVDSRGLITGVEGGQASVTASGTESGSSRVIAVTIVPIPAAEILITPSEAELRETQSVVLFASSSDDEDTYTWSSSDNTIATVNTEGLVTALIEGSATITARGSHSNSTGTAEITVAGRAPAAITVTPVESAIDVGQMVTFTAMSTDELDAFTWSTSNESIATVSQNGKVMAIGAGEALITAKGTASGDSGSGRVTVGSAEITIQSSGLPLPASSTEQFKAKSSDPNDKQFSWTSSNANVALVSDKGIVLALSEGTSTIRAVGNTSGSAGLQNITVIASTTSLLLWDGETGFEGVNAGLSKTQVFRGNGCLEAVPTRFASPRVDFVNYPGYRADLTIYDEIWFFAKADMPGRSTDFRVRSFQGNSNIVNIDNYIQGGVLDLEYRLVRIPIADLQTDTFDLSLVENIFFGVAKPSEGHHFFIDDVWAVSLGGTGAASAPLMGTVPGVNFSDVAVGTSMTRGVTLSNIGTTPMEVYGFSTAGVYKNEYSLENNSFTIAPGGTGQFNVTFTPGAVLSKAVGEKTANIYVAHSLTAMGTSTFIPLTGRAVAPVIGLSADFLNLGEVPVGQSVARTFSIANPGNVPLTVSSIDATNADFGVTPKNFTIDAGALKVITISFSPSQIGDAAGTLTIHSDATDMETLSVTVTGAGSATGSLTALSVAATSTTSSTATLAWPALSGSSSTKIYIGPEPSNTPRGPLPAELLVATIDGSVNTHTIENLAPAVDMFFHIETYDENDALIAQGNTHARTLGGPGAHLDSATREVHLVAPNILQVVVGNTQVHSFTLAGNVNDGGLDSVIGDIGAELQSGAWTITRQDGSPINITAIHRQSIPVGAPYYETGRTGGGPHLNLLDVDHVLYFVLDAPIGNREFLTVTGPEITRDVVGLTHNITQKTVQPHFLLPFSDKYLETPVIQLNQMGYSPAATERYAYVSAYMGDGGPMDFTGFPANASIYLDNEELLEPRTLVGSPIPMTLRAAFDEDAGTAVREIDLADLPPAEGVVYRVHIPGVGVSWPTQVSETAAFRSFYITTRFLTHNRWGRELTPDWTEWSTRPADHPTVFTSEVPFVDRFIPVGTPLVGERLVSGGHHDAGDFDINYSHTLHSLNLMRLYELQSDVFTDGQLNIPESGNGIPDLLDEIIYNLAVWEQLQELDGGIRPGFESTSHPTSINYADLDQIHYWTFARDPAHTIRVAGLFAQASTITADIDPVKSLIYRTRAIAAYNYARNNGVNANLVGPPMYATGELYRLTGQSDYRNLFEQIWQDNNTLGLGPGVFRFRPWNGSWFLEENQPILLDHIFGYLQSSDPRPNFITDITKRLDDYAEEAVDDVANFHAHRNGRRAALSPNWARGTAMGEYVKRIYARLQLGGLSPDALQRYYNTMSLSADYVLGGNPLGMVWLSGMGSRHPQEPLHADSQTFVADGLGAIPGIAIYGPRSGIPNTDIYDFGRRLFYPAAEELPRLRIYADINSWPATNEFTMQEAQVPQIVLFGMLVAPDMMPPDTWLPYGKEHRNPLVPREDATAAARK